MAAAWVVPSADAVTLGELRGELYSVSPRDEAHIGDEFIRRGGRVFPPARVVVSKARRPCGQDESLTQELEDADADARASGAVRMLRRATRAASAFLTSDELDVIQTALEAARAAARRVLGTGDRDEDEGGDEATPTDGESVATICWHPALRVLAVAQQDHVVSLYDVATAKWDARVLEHRTQVRATAAQWAPHSGGMIAVASR
jgi:hypothetical protein